MVNTSDGIEDTRHILLSMFQRKLGNVGRTLNLVIHATTERISY